MSVYKLRIHSVFTGLDNDQDGKIAWTDLQARADRHGTAGKKQAEHFYAAAWDTLRPASISQDGQVSFEDVINDNESRRIGTTPDTSGLDQFAGALLNLMDQDRQERVSEGQFTAFLKNRVRTSRTPTPVRSSIHSLALVPVTSQRRNFSTRATPSSPSRDRRPKWSGSAR
ncbi:EF-hand domain-containing protein [Streptomyces sp. NPDC012842]|uniref:EF-hand domain-containing protein n=1 Tax=Streptomyces TaxID=1883 RepID=UPI0033C5A874